MKNNNQEVMRRLSMRSLKNNRMRNTFAIAAIALTCMLFTTLAAMGTGISDAMQESTMREVGGRFHAGLKAATAEQMEKTVSDSRVKDYTWNIFISVAENLNKRQYEIRMPQGEEELENSFIKLEQGTMPQKEEDIIVDTYVLDELRLPHKLGGEIPLEFTFHGKKITRTFRVWKVKALHLLQYAVHGFLDFRFVDFANVLRLYKVPFLGYRTPAGHRNPR